MKIIKRYGWMMALLMAVSMTVPVKRGDGQAAVVAQAIKEGVKKVITAIDLKIQRMQNKTIWLQDAQKTLENTMSKLKLDEISSWVEKQRDLYKEYYEELVEVKSVIAYYQRVRDIYRKQADLIAEYKRAWSLFKQDKHFTPEELNYMARVYAGILDESAENINEILLVVSSFKTTMSDGKRLEMINKAADRVEANYDDLLRFNEQNKILSLQRAKDLNDIQATKELYGIQ